LCLIYLGGDVFSGLCFILHGHTGFKHLLWLGIVFIRCLPAGDAIKWVIGGIVSRGTLHLFHPVLGFSGINPPPWN
jgi:hypothetical protein